MKISYYPGCTLKTKAKNLEDAALASLGALGVEFEEMPRWNCCGAVFSLADDDLIHHVAPVRNLIRAREQGSDTIVTLCSQCYSTLSMANRIMREDEEKRKTLNLFMDEEPDYSGEVNVVHYLALLRDHVGWDEIRAKVRVNLRGLKVAPFYGCSLVRPKPIALNEAGGEVMQDFLRALGAEPVAFSAAEECCGSYQVLANPDAETKRAAKVLGSAKRAGAEAIALSCPLCEYNLGKRQPALLAEDEALAPLPTYYFTQLLAIALGLEPGVCRFELNSGGARELLAEREAIAAATG